MVTAASREAERSRHERWQLAEAALERMRACEISVEQIQALEASLALSGREALQVADFSRGFLVAAVVVLASVPLHARLPADAGREVSGHRG